MPFYLVILLLIATTITGIVFSVHWSDSHLTKESEYHKKRLKFFFTMSGLLLVWFFTSVSFHFSDYDLVETDIMTKTDSVSQYFLYRGNIYNIDQKGIVFDPIEHKVVVKDYSSVCFGIRWWKFRKKNVEYEIQKKSKDKKSVTSEKEKSSCQLEVNHCKNCDIDMTRTTNIEHKGEDVVVYLCDCELTNEELLIRRVEMLEKQLMENLSSFSEHREEKQ